LKLLENALLSNPYQGIPLGHNYYKIKLAIQSKGKGKRGGARIITFVVRIGNSDVENIGLSFSFFVSFWLLKVVF